MVQKGLLLRVSGGRLLPHKAFGVLAAVLWSNALAAGNTLDLTDQLVENFCPIIRLLAGPLVWVAIAVAFAIGLVLLLFGGRGAIRYMLISVVTAILFLVGSQWIKAKASEAGTAGGSNAFTQCLYGGGSGSGTP